LPQEGGSSSAIVIQIPKEEKTVMSKREERKWNRTVYAAIVVAVILFFIIPPLQKRQTEKLINQSIIATKMAQTYEATVPARVIGLDPNDAKTLWLEASPGDIITITPPPTEKFKKGEEVVVVELRREFDGSLVRRYISTQPATNPLH